MRNFHNAAGPKHLILVSVERIVVSLSGDSARSLKFHATFCLPRPGEIEEAGSREIHTAPAIWTPESARNSNDKLIVRNFFQDHEARALKPLTQVAGRTMAWHSSSASEGRQEAHHPQLTEVRV